MNLNKICAVAYTGGNSHLALIKAIKSGYTPSCLTFWEGGAEHRKNFSDISRLEIIKKHAEIIKTGFFVYKPDKNFNPKNPFMETRYCILEALKNYYANTIVMGYTADTEYLKEIIVLKKACEKERFKLITPLIKLKTLDLLEEYLKMNVKMMIVAISKKIPEKWLGKIIDEKFISFIENSEKRGVCILKPDFQVLAVKSELLKKEMKIYSSEVIGDVDGYYLNIKKFAFSGKT